MTKPRRSMAEADAKNQKIGLIVFSIVFAIVYALFVVPSSLFFHDYFVAASDFWNVTAFISIGVQYWFLWKKFRQVSVGEGDAFTINGILLGWLLLNVFLLGGWTFDLPR